MNKPSVSFVIPYYKVELALLARAVESVMRIGEEADWEIWVINDGTPGHEAEDYLRSLGDTRVNYHAQPNVGLGGARNTGMALARKEYVQFLDADDYLFLQPLRVVLGILTQQKPDLLAFGFVKVYQTGMQDKEAGRWKTFFQGDGTDFMLAHNLHGSACGYVFRKALPGGLQFTPGIYHEDEEFTPLLFLKARHVLVTDLPVYAYFQRQRSIMHLSDKASVGKRYADLQGTLLRLTSMASKMEGRQAAALTRRIDMVCMSMVYTLLGDSPDTAFLRQTLERMKQAGLYPLPPRHYSATYTLVRWCTSLPICAVVLSKVFRLFRLRHAGHAS